jgi:hypothetical protein
MPYVVKNKSGKKNVLGETFSNEREAKRAKYHTIIGGKNFREASRYLDLKIVKVASKKKK